MKEPRDTGERSIFDSCLPDGILNRTLEMQVEWEFADAAELQTACEEGFGDCIARLQVDQNGSGGYVVTQWREVCKLGKRAEVGV